MTILDEVKKYYEKNFKELEAFLETTSFFDTNSKYPKSVVIRFGKDKIVGEISVWELGTENYLEFEYVNLTKLNDEPISIVKTINSDTIIENLVTAFNELQKIANNNNNYR